MICLTGDVHHMSMKGSDQGFLHGSEVASALRYVEIAGRFGIKTTLFVTGRCVQEEHHMLSKIAQMDGVELGGHTFNAFKPILPYRLSHLLFNRKNGPCFVQNRDIRKTLQIISEKLGVKTQCWRNHGYRNDVNTRRLLVSSGINFLSDTRSSLTFSPYMDEGLCHLPINVLPDHDHIYHGVYQRTDTHGQNPGNNPFGLGRMGVEVWLDLVKQQIQKIIQKRGIATLLVHPCCMEIADSFQVFSELCQYLANFKSLTMSDIKPRIC